MNLLLIAGLLGFAIVAILAAVLLGIGEQRAEKARANNAIAPPTVTASPPARNKVVDGNTPPRATLPAPTEKTAILNTEEQTLSTLNGQFREFASELRSLHQQAWELEQRLRGMTEMVDRIETRANHISIEEEAK
jgi:hypothetical protein